MSIVSYAQNFEDVMLWRALGAVKNGFYIDIGARDPHVDSVSKIFYEVGWRGVDVDAIQVYCDALKKDRPRNLVIHSAVAENSGQIKFFEIPNTGISTGIHSIALEHESNGFICNEIVIPSHTLDEIMVMANAMQVHWMKIDVEGMEESVLSGWKNNALLPWIIVVESTLPCKQVYTHSQWEHILIGKGYQFTYFDGLNRFYISNVHLDLAAHFTSPPNVFDDFILSGFATSGFTQKVQLDANARVHEIEIQNQAIVNESDHLRKTVIQLENVLQLRSEELINIRSIAEQNQAEFTEVIKKKQNQFLQEKLDAFSTEAQLRVNNADNYKKELVQHKEAHKQVYELMNAQIKQLHANCQALQASNDALTTQAQVLQGELASAIKKSEDEYVSKLSALSFKADTLTSSLLSHEREYSRNLKVMQQRADVLSKTMQAREIQLSNQISMLRVEKNARIKQLHVNCQALQASNDALTTQAQVLQGELASAIKKSEDEYVAKLSALSFKADTLTSSLLSHEKEYSSNLKVMRQRADVLSETMRAREIQLSNQISMLRVEKDELTANSLGRETSLQNKLDETLGREQILLKSLANVQLNQLEQKAAIFEDHSNLKLQWLVERKSLQMQMQFIAQSCKRIENSWFWLLSWPLRAFSGIPNLPLTSSSNYDNRITIELARNDTKESHNIMQTSQNIYQILNLHGESFISAVYHFMLGRLPDESGRKHYHSRLESGFSKEAILCDIASSNEFKVRGDKVVALSESNYPKNDNAAFLHEVYRRILGREIELQGLNHHLNLMATNHVTRKQILHNLYASSEAKQYRFRLKDIKALKSEQKWSKIWPFASGIRAMRLHRRLNAIEHSLAILSQKSEIMLLETPVSIAVEQPVITLQDKLLAKSKLVARSERYMRLYEYLQRNFRS